VQPDPKVDNGGENAKFSSHTMGSHEVQGGKRTIYQVPAIEWVKNDETEDMEFGEDGDLAEKYTQGNSTMGKGEADECTHNTISHG
jgi:hypothetical protein